MLITTGQKKYIDAKTRAQLPNVTGATKDEVFRLLYENYSVVEQIIRTNSLKRWKSDDIIQDVVAEYFLYMAECCAKNEQDFIKWFNSPQFTFWIPKWCSWHLKHTDTTMYGKYDPFQGYQIHGVDLDDEMNEDLDIVQHSDHSEHQPLSVRQYGDLIRHILKSTQSQDQFRSSDTEFFFDNFILPYLTEGKPKRIFIKHVAAKKGLPYKSLLKRMIPIRNFLQKRLPPFIPTS